MNARKLITLVNLTAGKFSEALGWAFGNVSIETNGRNRQVSAAIALRCAQAKADARREMRAWELADKRLRGGAC